ncbi:MAG: ribosome maturation factor RimM [Gammaproteobacteria bacterium]|nr:MAG: ribosome maturation factor RimM [Gammaproteobacteria bacterium]
MTPPQSKQTLEDPLVLGRISGLFGVKGWVRVHSYTEPRRAILDYGGWLLWREDNWLAAQVAEGREHGKSVVVRLEGVADRDAAAAYVGADIGVAREQMPEPAAGRYYWADLEGLEVVHRDGRPLGKVAYLLATGANDVLVVQGEREILVPFVTDEVILDVDLAAGTISVDWEWD